MKKTTSEQAPGSVKNYVIGFVLSVSLTLLAYFLVQDHVSSNHSTHAHNTLLLAVMGLAGLQLIVQLVYFLHLGHESKPRWNLALFGFMTLMVLIIVIGSLWIMDNLNYNMMNSHETSQEIIKDEGFDGGHEKEHHAH